MRTPGLVRRSSGLAAGVALVAAGLGGGCGGPGGPKPGAPAHHLEHGFRNLNPEFGRPPFWPRAWWVGRQLLQTTFRPRTATLPRVENDGRALRESGGGATITWVGHATFLVQLDGVNLLTDPHWGERASPVAWGGPKRVTPPGLRLEDLPPIHVVVISHDHYDHLDLGTVRALRAAHRPRFVVPLGLKAWLAEQGIAEVEEADWWETRQVRGLALTAAPAQHWAARSWFDRNRRLWASWVVAGRDRRLYFGGDTGYHAPIFAEIGRRLGPFDVAALAIGGYQPAFMMRQTHTTPEEALRIFADLRADRFVGMHWGTFDLTDEPFEEPPERLAAEVRRLGLDPGRVWVMKPGETRPW